MNRRNIFLASLILIIKMNFAVEEKSYEDKNFGIDVTLSPHALKYIRIAPLFILSNWRFTPGAYLFLAKGGKYGHSLDPIIGLALGGLILKVNDSKEVEPGALIGLLVLGALLCVPNAEYVIPISLVGIRPSIMWTYNLIPTSWTEGNIQSVNKIGFGLRKRIKNFDLAGHLGRTGYGTKETSNLAFGVSASFYVGSIRLDAK